MTPATAPDPAPISDRRERTRQALLQAGLTLLARQPVDAISIDEIVRAAGVAKGSFFNHFQDKATFAAAIARQLREELETAVGETNAGVADPAHRVARAICVYIRYAARAPQKASVLLQVTPQFAHAGAVLNQGVLDDVSSGLLAGRFTVPTAEAGVLLVLGVAQIVLARVVREPNPALAEALGQQLCALLLRGLGLAGDDAGRIAAQAAHEVIAAL